MRPETIAMTDSIADHCSIADSLFSPQIVYLLFFTRGPKFWRVTSIDLVSCCIDVNKYDTLDCYMNICNFTSTRYIRSIVFIVSKIRSNFLKC